jgi:hypothetical protein
VTAIPLRLAAYESVFVVFNQPAKQAKNNSLEINYPTPEIITDLNEAWKVSFEADSRGPIDPVTFNKLIDWTTSTDDQIKYYSGTAIYEKSISLTNIPSDERVIIDLGAVTSMARVSVNGKQAGGVWTAPYRLDISDLVVDGRNHIRIEVVNNWMNRLIGDQQLPEEERETWAPYNTYTAESKLQPSGLFGPVSISTIKY